MKACFACLRQLDPRFDTTNSYILFTPIQPRTEYCWTLFSESENCIKTGAISKHCKGKSEGCYWTSLTRDHNSWFERIMCCNGVFKCAVNIMCTDIGQETYSYQRWWLIYFPCMKLCFIFFLFTITSWYYIKHLISIILFV